MARVEKDPSKTRKQYLAELDKEYQDILTGMNLAVLDRDEATDEHDLYLPLTPEEHREADLIFRRIVLRKFVDGEDVDFDYSTVDTNEEYDRNPDVPR